MEDLVKSPVGYIKGLGAQLNHSPWRECEVDEGDLSGHLGGVVGVGQLGGDVELEVVVVGDDGVSQLDDGAPGLLEGLLQEDGLQGGVKLLSHVLQEAGLAESVGVGEGERLNRLRLWYCKWQTAETGNDATNLNLTNLLGTCSS